MSPKYAATLTLISGLISTLRGTTFLVGLTQQTSLEAQRGRLAALQWDLLRMPHMRRSLDRVLRQR
jgi:hypothetical protein